MTELPKNLGRYRILGRLGAGAMGEVFLAEDPQIDRRLAIKTVRVAGADGGELAERRNRLLREAKAAGRLVHPNVITLFDAGEEGGVVFLVFEYVEGVDLRDRLRKRPPPTLREILRIVRQVASALAAAHDSSIIHRDVKPGNILLTKSGDAKIGDFGIAKMRDQVSDLTASGAVVGTPHYMSPEQIRGERLDGRSDLFSLGAILYETLHGVRPFDGETITTVVFQILHHDPLSSMRPDLPPGMVELFQRLLAKNKEERFADGNQVARAIEDLERSLPPEVLDTPAHGVLLPSIETAPTRVSPGAAGATGASIAAPPPPPSTTVPPSLATAAPIPPRPPQPSPAPQPSGGPQPPAAPPSLQPVVSPAVSPAPATAQTGAAGHRRIHPGAIAALGCFLLLAVGSVLGLVFAWPMVSGWIGLGPPRPPVVAEQVPPETPSDDPSSIRTPQSSQSGSDEVPKSNETASDDADVTDDFEPPPVLVPGSTRPETTRPEERLADQPAPERSSPANQPSTRSTTPDRQPSTSETAPTTKPSPAKQPERTAPRTTPVEKPSTDPPKPTERPAENDTRPVAPPPAEEPAAKEDAEPSAPEIPFDSRLRTGRRIALHVEPEDVYVLVRGPGDERFTLVGQAEEFDTRRRRRQPLELSEGGTQYLMLRRDGYPDHVVLLEVDDSIRGETTLALRLGAAGRRRP